MNFAIKLLLCFVMLQAHAAGAERSLVACNQDVEACQAPGLVVARSVATKQSRGLNKTNQYIVPRKGRWIASPTARKDGASNITKRHSTVMRFQAHIRPEVTKVGDVLRIVPDKKHWSQIQLDSQPKHGNKISEKQMISWLQHKVGVFSYQWQGKHTAIVQQITQSKAQDILNKAQSALVKHLNEQGYEKVLLSSKTQLHDSPIALDDFKVRLPKEHPVAKRVCVHLNAKNRSIPIWFSVKAYQSVFVATHHIKSHTLAQEKDFVQKKLNIAGLKNPPTTQLMPNMWLNKSMNKNQILTQEDLGIQPEVLQGQKVKVTVQQSGISIIVEALAQSNGAIWEEIRMKNPRTNKYFMARVSGKGMAEVGV